MRAARLLEMLLLLQRRRAMTAPELAAALEVSVRTVYRDIAALAAAGVPVYTEPGRNGGVRLLDTFDGAWTGTVGSEEARALVLAGVPAVAASLGLDAEAAEARLIDALAGPAGRAVRDVHNRLLVETEPWWGRTPDEPHLAELARAVWDSREVRLAYEGARGSSSPLVRPLGLVLKGDVWYLIADPRRGARRMYRVSRVRSVDVLAQRFDRPVDFDLAADWAERKAEFVAAIPRYPVEVRVSPAGRGLLGMLAEGTPDLPLPDDLPIDDDGWTRLTLTFERPESAARLLLQLAGDIEVLAPPELRGVMTEAAESLDAVYRSGSGPPE
ncbi:MAG: helix-turn-helix transcriptional regulator [Acidimicrobiales bacterium]